MAAQKDIRNIAIIAHVDHGKTTMVDQLLRQAGTFGAHETVADRVMDSGDLEREKGITIMAKNTSIDYKDKWINIVDTPGHSDFGGEVERIMTMVDGVLLVVDAFEGCMPQTRFVLKKALAANLVPIVVINKMDKAVVRPEEVLDEIIDLFIDLDASESQLDFPVYYASGIQGKASADPDSLGEDFVPLLDAIVESIPAPKGDPDGSLQAQITLMDYSDYVGKIAITAIRRGHIKNGQMVAIMDREGQIHQSRISKLYGFQGLDHVPLEEAGVGEIVAIAGLGEISIGETICDPGKLDPLPFIEIDEPTLEMTFMVNNSPFAGLDGTPITGRQLRTRLLKEMESDVALKVQNTDSADMFRAAGRGELHLAILIEKMRREGLEFQVSMPQVIIREIDGILQEPYERVTLDFPEAHMGPIMEEMSSRKAQMENMIHRGGEVRLEYILPSRGLIGFRSRYMTDTHGYGLINSLFEDYRPFSGQIEGRRSGVLIAHEAGTATPYGLHSAEDRGTLFIGPGTEVYEGMIIGEANRDQDVSINVSRQKKLTNIRAAGKDDGIQLKSPRDLSLEASIAFLNDDEYLEVTPHHLRLRKRFLRAQERAAYAKRMHERP